MATREDRLRRQRRRRRTVMLERIVIALLIVFVLVLVVDVVAHQVQLRQPDADMQSEGLEDVMPDAIPADTESEMVMEIQTETEVQEEEEVEEPTEVQVGDAVFWSGYSAVETDDTVEIDLDSVVSDHAILIDMSKDTIVAGKDAYSRISPASMTKILTVLVAAELVEDWDATVEITVEMTDYAYVNGCSTVGFTVGEQVPVTDLFYGTILPSGADAAVALAVYTAGSHDAFIDKMNEKVEELGLSETSHFMNCVGLYDADHYSTCYDMAMILKAALENDFLREVLSTHKYTTTPTEEHPDGITISNWFLRRIEDKDTGGTVVAAKTGFVNQSGNCSASYQISEDGIPYICVTTGSSSSWRCIYDQVDIYNNYH